MFETKGNTHDFVGYEYSDVLVAQSKEALYVDGYQNFGWQLETISNSFQYPTKTSIKFKRNRMIERKVELIHFQRQFDCLVAEIESYEKSRSLSASAWAYTVGLIGTAFLAGSVFAMLADMIPLMIILAIPGFIGWALPYFLYKNIRAKKTAETAPLIEERYNAIYNISKQANALLV